MKCENATFTIKHKDTTFLVMFIGGDEPIASVMRDGELLLKVDNARSGVWGIYKPCMTHAIELIRRALPKPPATEFDKRRRDKTPRLTPSKKTRGLSVFT